MTEYRIQVLEDDNGNRPYVDWFRKLRNQSARDAIITRLDRAKLGDFGHWRSVQGGLRELKIDTGPGYRVYYYMNGNTVILLIAGSSKKDQDRVIKQASKLLEKWKRHEGH